MAGSWVLGPAGGTCGPGALLHPPAGLQGGGQCQTWDSGAGLSPGWWGGPRPRSEPRPGGRRPRPGAHGLRLSSAEHVLLIGMRADGLPSLPAPAPAIPYTSPFKVIWELKLIKIQKKIIKKIKKKKHARTSELARRWRLPVTPSLPSRSAGSPASATTPRPAGGPGPVGRTARPGAA